MYCIEISGNPGNGQMGKKQVDRKTSRPHILALNIPLIGGVTETMRGVIPEHLERGQTRWGDDRHLKVEMLTSGSQGKEGNRKIGLRVSLRSGRKAVQSR